MTKVERRDVLVLGGGFAGLAAAIRLASLGREVTLIERHASLGGKAGEVRIDGFRFDTGPSVVTLPHVLEQPFTTLGKPFPVAWRALDPLARYRFASGRTLDVSRDVDATTAQLDAREARAYRTLLEEARILYEAAAPVFVHGPPPTLPQLARYGLRHGLRARPWARLPDLLRHHGAEGDVRDLFLRFATYFGADPFRAPAILHNIAWVELGLGVVAPVGGVGELVRAYGELARSLGVRMQLDTRVDALTPRPGRAPEVHALEHPGSDAAHGVTYAPDVVVSTLDRERTLAMLGRSPRRAAEPSLSGMVLLLGVEGTHPDVMHHTLSMPARYDAEFEAMRQGEMPTDPTLYVSLSARSHPADAPDGMENWFVMANAPAQDAAGRGVDEAAYAERILALLEARGWLDRNAVRVQRTVGPAHLATLATRGAIYGQAPHSLLATLRPPQTVRGERHMRLAGGTVHPGGGIPLAVTSGWQAASDLAGVPVDA